jgi:hypothetical protein
MAKGAAEARPPSVTRAEWLTRAQEWNPFAILNNRPPPALRDVPFRERNRIGRMAGRGQKAPDSATGELVREYARWMLGRWTWKRTIAAAVLVLPGALVTGDPLLTILAVSCLISALGAQRFMEPKLRRAIRLNSGEPPP